MSDLTTAEVVRRIQAARDAAMALRSTMSALEGTVDTYSGWLPITIENFVYWLGRYEERLDWEQTEGRTKEEVMEANERSEGHGK